MEKAAKARIEKQVSKAVEKVLDSKQAAMPQVPIPKPDKSFLQRFLDWEGISFVTLSLAGLGFLTVPHSYPIAKLCFIGAATSLAIKLALGVKTTLYPRVLIAVLAATVVGVGVNRVNDWVTDLEREEASKPSFRTIILKEQPSKTTPQRRVPSSAQTEEIKQLRAFITDLDEMALRNEFGFPQMMTVNIKAVKDRTINFKMTGHDDFSYMPYQFDGGSMLLSGEQGEVRRGGAIVFEPHPDRVSLVLLPKEYSAGEKILGRFENSTELPIPVISAVKDFDLAVQENANNLIRALNSALQKNPDYYLRYDDFQSPYFHKVDGMWLEHFIQLRPKADKVRDAIRQFIGVK